MTSVVGILNKRGVALAADSAVTRNRYKENGFDSQKVTKCTKNGNKMVRLSNAVPVTVMFTGNAAFLGTPWDVIARRYRQKRGEIAHATVEDAVNDFFRFISENPVFWDQEAVNNFMNSVMSKAFYNIVERMHEEKKRDEKGSLLHPEDFKKTFIRKCRTDKLRPTVMGECPHFVGYSLDAFREQVSYIMDIFFIEKGFDNYPDDLLSEIRLYFEEDILSIISARYEAGHFSELVFSGFGAEQECPSLIPVCVHGGFDFRVNYHYSDEDVVNISDKRPVAICPFAQTDVIKSILRGIHGDWSQRAVDMLRHMISADSDDIFGGFLTPVPKGFRDKLDEIDVDDLYKQFIEEGLQMCDETQKEWEKSLKDYDLEEMAALADSLIDLTGFQRVLTFSQEGVGGPVDLAVISKADGFTWIRRKNWYHKDNGLSI